MHKKPGFAHCRRGLTEIITAIFMLLLMVAALTAFLSIYSTMNSNSQDMSSIDLQRSQEKITLQKNTASGEVRSVNIYNDGSIEVKIMAIYTVNDEGTTFLGDPNTDHTTFQPCQTNIAPTQSITINFQDGQEPSENDKIIASTQRGTKSYDLLSSLNPTPKPTYPPSDLVIGPLMLKFKDFQYQQTSGTINPAAWNAGWNVPKGISCAFKISITNIDERDITLSRYSALSPIANEFSSGSTWFLEPTNPNTLTQELPAEQDSEMIFIWSAPKNFPYTGLSNTPSTFYNAECTCSVFLTLYGVYHEQDGTLTPYSQTIPFEALVMSKK